MEVEDKRHVRNGGNGAACAYPLPPGNCFDIMFVHPGGAGVVAHLATRGGTRPWVNPMLTSTVQACLSLPLLGNAMTLLSAELHMLQPI